MMWGKRLIRWWPVLVLVLVFALGVLGGRAWFPKTVVERVDREIVRVVERLMPGQTVTVVREVPGETQVIRVPVEVTRIVERLGPERVVERVVTITRPVDVPVEVIRREWPQSITVRVGGVLSLGQWHIPDHPDLTIGQVAPGVYAVSSTMPGWRIESVRTETRIETPKVATPLPYHLGFTFGFLDDRLYSGLSYTNRVGPGYYSAIVAYGFPGVVLGASFTLPIR